MLPQNAMLSLWDSFSNLLEANGFSPLWLFVGLSVFFVVLLLSFREFLCWYVKIYQTQSMIADLKTEIQELKQQINTKPAVTVNEIKTEPQTAERPVDRFVHFN